MNPEPAGKARILVVDDEPNILHAVSRILGKKHVVECVGSGERGLEAAETFRPDLAIVDIWLPAMNGFEVTRALKAIRPDVDVIIMTGDTEEPDETLIRAIDEGAFYFIQKPFNRRVLLTLVARCLELRALRRDRERFLARVARELDQAREFQQSLLPPKRAKLPGLSVAARYLGCHELAGDFYDYVPLGVGAAVLIADVVGHGTSAAMMTAVVKAAFRAAHAEDYEPSAVIDRLKESVRDFDPARFVTLCCGRVDPARGEFRYVNAGHPEPILLGPGGGEPVLLDSTGPILSSVFMDVPYEQRSHPLAPGDAIFLYTDGVTEARGPAGMYGRDRIVSHLQAGRRGDELLDGLLADLAAFTGSPTGQDDITMLAVEVEGS
ncbi:PP2C family protein-serine/threonine phosphatase [Aquisphaera insulae]|uniref:PP2C family protein-serine/threonine phosphatase n=1 Tax=Aquisphaera insulae TaxID=2712864 RepID=UPI0013EA457F|nr:response regulator [Aquisphaera insulae]